MSYHVPTGVNAGVAGLPAVGLAFDITGMFIMATVLIALGLALLTLVYSRREDTGT